ncbi:MAG: class I SAM-dependent methyltransferase [Acidobacteriota bacterium]|nr:class I SAM-dependent methyltransferase [Acidobacteriota bacterium]
MGNKSKTSWLANKHHERSIRALERQLEYQRKKAESLRGEESKTFAHFWGKSQFKRQMLQKIHPITPESKVLEVGSGAHGLIFGFGECVGVGIDPLAVHYKNLFPTWQKNVPTIAAIGEQLPFADAAFDVVLSDNVIDHAERPVEIIYELVRVLKPGGLLYFTVNVHHPFYSFASDLHGFWNALGIPLELSAFADHTVHFTPESVSRIFAELPLEIVEQKDNVGETKRNQRQANARNLDASLKKLFYKNALFELTAIKRS